MIERSHLEIIRGIDRHRTLTEASAILHLSQSALSHAIRKLESRTGTKIWIKQGRNLEFTDTGRFLLSLANRILPQLEHGDRALKQFSNGKKGTLRIGMECHPCYQWLLKVVLPFLQTWPEVDLDIKKDFQFDGYSSLKDHETDLLITPDLIKDNTLIFTPIFPYELVLIVARNHKLAPKSYVTTEDLETETLLTYPVGTDRLDIFTNFLIPSGCKPASHKVIEDHEIMIQMVAAERGVTALPNWMFAEYNETLPIKALRLGSGGLHKKLYTAIRAIDHDVDYIQAFVSSAIEVGETDSS
ncbi:MAG: LysR family transcriptional regulator [Desulfobulbaceae bacterium]|nr:MAG: LysR family transcriptional regulator [Desulfobulbaceae bacterium]